MSNTKIKHLLFGKLNNNCSYKFNDYRIIFKLWSPHHINFVDNGDRDYCAIYYDKNDNNIPEKILCQNCNDILEKYQKMHNSNTDTLYDTLLKILDRLDKIDNDIKNMKNIHNSIKTNII